MQTTEESLALLVRSERSRPTVLSWAICLPASTW